MKETMLRIATLIMGLCFFSSNCLATGIDGDTTARADTLKHIATVERESVFPGGSKPLSESPFTWGAELGASIDLGSHDLSTVDIDVVIGYKSSLIRTLGITAGIHRSFGSNNTFVPISLIFRSSFRRKPSPCFLHLGAGYSFNTLSSTDTKGGINASIGLGINLAMSRRFKSHIILAYRYMRLHAATRQELSLPPNISIASISFGVNF